MGVAVPCLSSIIDKWLCIDSRSSKVLEPMETMQCTSFYISTRPVKVLDLREGTEIPYVEVGGFIGRVFASRTARLHKGVYASTWHRIVPLYSRSESHSCAGTMIFARSCSPHRFKTIASSYVHLHILSKGSVIVT
jgi:hypothetical protein